jgi:phosphoglucosamine mutase
VVVDCANGAAYRLAPEALRRAGARVETIGATPDGLNINQGYGSTDLAALQRAVVERGASAGIALDGDADRCLAVDAGGEVIDGDQIMGILALAMRSRGELAHDTVVATVMSNLGFRIAMDQAGIKIVETAVGDRYVLEAMQTGGYSLGGEQSGHVILLAHATTGDGLLTALHVLGQVAATGQSLADLAAVVHRLPQVLVNVTGVDKTRAMSDEAIRTAVGAAETALGATGRVLLRPSGTEDLIRIMVEAPTEPAARQVAHDLESVVRSRLGGG